MPIWMSFLFTVACIVGVGFLSNFLGESLPRSLFRPDRFPYRSYRWERNGKVYEKFGVRRWKDHVPDMSRLRKKKMISKHLGICPTADRVRTLTQETCRAEAVHITLCLLSPLLLFFWAGRWIGLGIGIVILYILFNVPFIMIQRYNRPALSGLEERLRRRESRKAEKRLIAAEGEVASANESPDSVC